jgi:DNA-binding response OmpR family regulator
MIIMAIYEYENMTVDTRQRRVFVNNIVVRLFRIEYAILLLFMENPGKWLSKAEIFAHIRNYPENRITSADEKLVDSHILTLKKTLQRIDENAGNHIVGGARGYKLDGIL